MAHYLLEVCYTPQAWAAMLMNPQDRSEAVEPAIQSLGGRMDSFWLTFREYDLVGIVEMPDSVSAAAFSMAPGRIQRINAIMSMDKFWSAACHSYGDCCCSNGPDSSGKLGMSQRI